MPEVKTPPPTTPVGIPKPKVPVNPGQRHHAPPQARPVETPTPAPQPKPQPKGVGIAVALSVISQALKCPVGTTVKGRKKAKDYDDQPSPRRQCPCPGGGEPTVTRRDRRRRIGRFHIEKTTGAAVPANQARLVKKETERVAKEAGYKTGEFGNVRIESELDSPKGYKEIIRYELGGGYTCFYQVWAITKRRICTCPDGSKCRSTVRKD